MDNHISKHISKTPSKSIPTNIDAETGQPQSFSTEFSQENEHENDATPCVYNEEATPVLTQQNMPQSSSAPDIFYTEFPQGQPFDVIDWNFLGRQDNKPSSTQFSGKKLQLKYDEKSGSMNFKADALNFHSTTMQASLSSSHNRNEIHSQHISPILPNTSMQQVSEQIPAPTIATMPMATSTNLPHSQDEIINLAPTSTLIQNPAIQSGSVILQEGEGNTPHIEAGPYTFEPNPLQNQQSQHTSVILEQNPMTHEIIAISAEPSSSGGNNTASEAANQSSLSALSLENLEIMPQLAESFTIIMYK